MPGNLCIHTGEFRANNAGHLHSVAPWSDLRRAISSDFPPTNYRPINCKYLTRGTSAENRINYVDDLSAVTGCKQGNIKSSFDGL